MNAGRVVAYAAGLIVITILISRLPDAILRSTQMFLLVAAGLLLVTVTAAMALLPARRLLVEVFSLPVRVPERGVLGLAKPDEVNAIARPLLIALACAGVAAVAGIVH